MNTRAAVIVKYEGILGCIVYYKRMLYEGSDMSYVCRSLSVPITALARMTFRVSGYQVRVIGRQATPAEAPILLFAPHGTFLDGFVAHWTGLPCLIIRGQDRSLPGFGRK